jgi:cation diffusion facilitator CzcD-associated flavoprotein CzcO
VNGADRRPRESALVAEHFDVVVVGAGISGVGAAYHLKHQCPDSSFVVFESLPTFGGTWVTHRYPGIRSDSDLYTYGYRFKPWVGPPVATAAEILAYMGEVIEENALAERIRYRHTIRAAKWSTKDARWTLEIVRGDTGEELRVSAGFLWMCQGYYRHAKGYTPEWPGMADFEGRIVHPQTWPEDLEWKGRKVVVIGSGATAATLVPAIADEVEHVTMLQRSPTYFIPAPNENELANTLREIRIREDWIHEIVRRKVLHDQEVLTRRCLEEPDVVRAELLDGVRQYLGPDYDMDKHFAPGYRPWRQRVAYVPDGDLFKGIVSGKAEVVTDVIERFTRKGILLESGRELEADLIVTATGFELCVAGGIAFEVDGKPLRHSDTVTYRGMMFTGVPNLVWVMGYFRASWTLRVDLICEFVCRLLLAMKEKGASRVAVELRPDERDLPRLPWIDAENFNPGYLLRGLDQMPKRLDRAEWQHTQDYWADCRDLPAIDLDDDVFVYS